MGNVIPKLKEYENGDEKVFIFHQNIGIDFGKFEPWCADAFLTRAGVAISNKEADIILEKKIWILRLMNFL
ncbi:MAG: hypothetical protein Q4B22_02470 [Eubacteriales bacterium]|nr:hypothetical protein [Eubacteriales bacterium]